MGEQLRPLTRRQLCSRRLTFQCGTADLRTITVAHCPCDSACTTVGNRCDLGGKIFFVLTFADLHTSRQAQYQEDMEAASDEKDKRMPDMVRDLDTNIARSALRQ